MQAITIRDRDAGVGGLCLTEVPYPHAAVNDVIVRVHAAGSSRGSGKAASSHEQHGALRALAVLAPTSVERALR